MTTDSAARVESAKSRLEQIHRRLAEVPERTPSAPHVECSHGEEIQQLTAALSQVEHELEGLRVAMATRGVIEQAKGMLMIREGCDADQAFAMLVDLSQHTHRKLVEVAQTMVTSWSTGERAEP